MGWLEGKVAWVTGGASGIGRAVVERFIAEGARVTVLDRSAEGLAALSRRYDGAVLRLMEGDVRNWDDNRRACEETVAAFAGIDVVVANAGIFDGFVSLRRLPEPQLAPAFDQVMGVNVLAPLYAVKAALPYLDRRPAGASVIFTASGASFYPDGGGPLYTASKHALLGLIRQLAFELAPRIRVNGVAPGGTRSALAVAPALRELVGPLSEEERGRRIRERNPLGLLMEPEDHVGAYVLLASDQARAVTGTVIESDGGLGVRGLAGPRA